MHYYDTVTEAGSECAMKTDNVPTRESSLQTTSKEHREQAIKEKLKTKVGRRYCVTIKGGLIKHQQRDVLLSYCRGRSH